MDSDIVGWDVGIAATHTLCAPCADKVAMPYGTPYGIAHFFPVFRGDARILGFTCSECGNSVGKATT